MKVLVVGSGGREHAICWALKAEPQGNQSSTAPPATAASRAIAQCVDVKATDVAGHGGLGQGKSRWTL